MKTERSDAHGWPGAKPRWTSAAKSGVGTAAGPQSRVWFTIGEGIVNEVYFPDPDRANVRDFGFIVTGPDGFFSEERRNTSSKVSPVATGVPGFRIVSECDQGRYRLEKTVICDPRRDVLLQALRFESTGRGGDLSLFALLNPHIGNAGFGNDAWVLDVRGVPMLFASRAGTWLALASFAPFLAGSCGFVGRSDGWQDLRRNGKLTWRYNEALGGNVALCGEVDVSSAGSALVVLAFGRSRDEAATLALESAADGFERALDGYVRGWTGFQDGCLDLDSGDARPFPPYRVSTAVLKSHAAKTIPGGMVAGLSIPWGSSKGDKDLGGYHLVWPRDLVECAGGLLAAGRSNEALASLVFLAATQDADGHWPQNMWLDGTPYWNGIQLDETALPILLADAVGRTGALVGFDPWPMIRRGAGYIVRNGPVTQEDRWEEDEGYSPFTLAAEVAALLVAADWADTNGERALGHYFRETADWWNECIERWIYVEGTEFANAVGVRGYYVRIAPADETGAASPAARWVPIKNRPQEQARERAALLVSPDALALVRFGLRAASDPRILDTIAVVDAHLKTETRTGPAWYRYNGDGYGEHDDGAPFDGTGAGRSWPLLAGERAHYELAAGRPECARRLLDAIESQSGVCGLIPEQIWDGPDIPERGLLNGRPTGSAMPLAWAHAEYVKALRSLRDGRVFDLPPQSVARYLASSRGGAVASWRFNQKIRSIPRGRLLRLEALTPAVVRWSTDEWVSSHDIGTIDTTVGISYVDLPVADLADGARVTFTFYWPAVDRWEGRDFSVVVAPDAARI